MRHLPYSYEAIREVYDKENRKGKINLALLPDDYKEIITNLHEKRKELSELKKISKKKLDKDAKDAYLTLISTIRQEISNLVELKEQNLTKFLKDIELNISNNRYYFEVIRDENFVDEDRQKEYFHIKKDDLVSLIMSKLLCKDLSSSFKVKAANRHHIMACLKLLLIGERPFTIIRTDISNFFESIPQDYLEKLISSNHFVSRKTLGCIRSVFKQYNSLKRYGSSERGVPRGIGISAYLTEILMREVDIEIKKKLNVIFYARYVDDIIMVLSNPYPYKSGEEYFDSIAGIISNIGLTLHPLNDGKSQVVEYDPKAPKTQELEYLGYKIIFSEKKVKFYLSQKRNERLRERIINAFDYFKRTYKSDPRKARRDLLDCLKLLSGNTSLHKCKNGVKTGLFYSNDLINEDCKQLSDLQNFYIHANIEKISLDVQPFGSVQLRDEYLIRLQHSLRKINFPDGWKSKRTYSFSVKRMSRLSKILG